MTHKKQNKIDKIEDDMYHNDVVFEEESVSRMVGGINEEKVKKLKEKLSKCIKENKENLLGWQRARADFVNAKKENEQKIKQSYSFAKRNIVEELLPVVDSFEIAFADKEAWEKVDKNWRIGVEYIYTQLLSVLENNGFKQIHPIGEKFDPNFHISIEIIDTNKKKEDNTIVDVIQKGYEINGEILRAAKVKVAQYKD
jgi:molecular chaperone GrpE